jgi:hypothetical protein
MVSCLSIVVRSAASTLSRPVAAPLPSHYGGEALLAGNSLLSLQPVHDEEADQNQGESEAEQQVQPSDIGICGHRSTLRFLEVALHFWNPSKPMQDTDAPVGQKGFTMSIHSTVVAVDCLDK